MKKEQIKHLQTALNVEVDGVLGPITKRAYADKLISLAKKEIGVSEIGTSNTGKRVKEYQSTTDLGGTGWPWCSAFLTFIFKESGMFTERDRPTTAAAFVWEVFANKIGMILEKNPRNIKRGDLVIFRFSHIGIATSDSDKNGVFSTIEGNTDGGGSREGGCVMEKTRQAASVRSVVRL